MDSKTLEAYGNDILGGAEVSAVEALIDAELRTVRKPSVYITTTVAITEDGEKITSRKLNPAVVRPAYKAVVDTPEARVDDPDEVATLGVWETRLDPSDDGGLMTLSGGRTYEHPPAEEATRLTLRNRLGEVVETFTTSPTATERWGTEYVTGAAVRQPNSRYVAAQRDWEREEFLDHRAPIVSGEAYDEEYTDEWGNTYGHGYRLDPRRRKSENALEMMYGPRVEVTEKDVERDEYGDMVNHPGRGFKFTVVKETRQGSVGWEYERLNKVLSTTEVDPLTGGPKRAGLPWIGSRCNCRRLNRVCHHVHPNGAAPTYKWFRALEARDTNQKARRNGIIRFLRQLGQDPHNPEIAAWVKRVGYEEALLALDKRARKEANAA